MKKGTIIYLEGVSSSGKTTLSRALQKRLPEPYFWVAADVFEDMAPPTKEIENNLIWPKLKLITLNTLKLYSDLGIDVIFDMVPVGKSDIIESSANTFLDSPVLYVGVTCPLEELRRREKERGDRIIGLSESQLVKMVSHYEYDITVDTYANSSEECADKIIEMLTYPEKFTAFNNFRLQYFE